MTSEGPPDVVAHDAATGGLSISEPQVEKPGSETEVEGLSCAPPTLGSLPVGARLILRCRADWRAATVAAFEPERVVLNVASPKGHAYRVRRPADSPLAFDGRIPVLGEGCWRAGLARYDVRW
jgi:hypothetical protein